MDAPSGGLTIGGTEAKLKRGPLMMSLYSANRDKNFWSSTGRGYAGYL